MLRNAALTLLLVLGLLAVPALAADETQPEPTSAVAKAELLLKQGKFEEARDAYLALAKADPENEELVTRALVLKRVVDLRTMVATEEVSPTWERATVALHSFYVRNGLADVALEAGKAAHAKASSDVSASLVADSLLEKGANQEAVDFVEGLRMAQQTPQNLTYESIALARLGRIDEAREIQKLYGTSDTKDPGLLFDTARVQSLMGDSEQALATLKTAFENTPERALPMLKELAKSSPDLSTLARMPAFGEVMKTASKASDCGSGCGGGGCGEKSGGCGGGGCGEKSGGCGGGGCAANPNIHSRPDFSGFRREAGSPSGVRAPTPFDGRVPHGTRPSSHACEGHAPQRGAPPDRLPPGLHVPVPRETGGPSPGLRRASPRARPPTNRNRNPNPNPSTKKGAALRPRPARGGSDAAPADPTVPHPKSDEPGRMGVCVFGGDVRYFAVVLVRHLFRLVLVGGVLVVRGRTGEHLVGARRELLEDLLCLRVLTGEGVLRRTREEGLGVGGPLLVQQPARQAEGHVEELRAREVLALRQELDDGLAIRLLAAFGEQLAELHLLGVREATATLFLHVRQKLELTLRVELLDGGEHPLVLREAEERVLGDHRDAGLEHLDVLVLRVGEQVLTASPPFFISTRCSR